MSGSLVLEGRTDFRTLKASSSSFANLAIACCDCPEMLAIDSRIGMNWSSLESKLTIPEAYDSGDSLKRE